MTLSSKRIVSALGVFAVAFISACGSDSTAPGSVDANGALQSLALGLQGVSGIESPTSPDVSTALSGIAPLLDQVNVTIDGTSRGMFALGLRETYPDGTCEENLYIDPNYPPPPGVCTPPTLGLALILWQSHSATEPPDRMIFVEADAGTSDFDFASSVSEAAPAFAFYIEGTNNFWSSLSGTLTSQVTATSQSCSFPLPPYAKTGTCSVASFDEQGSIGFETFMSDDPNVKHMTMVIPRQTLDGLWLAITEVQSVPFTGNRAVPGLLGMRLNRVSPQVIPGR